MAPTMQPEIFDSWLAVDRDGLYCRPGAFHIDPLRGVDRAVITHAHADHARPGLGTALATEETLAIMQARLGEGAPKRSQSVGYGEVLKIGEVSVWLAPAGHVLGSAQVVIEWGGVRAVVSGDYKRQPDPTCAPFELVSCDLFVTEATFALPVFRHGAPADEIGKLLRSVEQFPERTHAVGAYGLGKTQRVIKLLREAGYERPIWLHGALQETCAAYERFGVSLGELRPATGEKRDILRGEIVLAPPSAITDRWSRRLPEPVTAFASGWMRVRARARQRGVELPMIISDHADWDELVQTIEETEAREIWVTHGQEDALIYQIEKMGKRGRALRLIGFEEEDQ